MSKRPGEELSSQRIKAPRTSKEAAAMLTGGPLGHQSQTPLAVDNRSKEVIEIQTDWKEMLKKYIARFEACRKEWEAGLVNPRTKENEHGAILGWLKNQRDYISSKAGREQYEMLILLGIKSLMLIIEHWIQGMSHIVNVLKEVHDHLWDFGLPERCKLTSLANEMMQKIPDAEADLMMVEELHMRVARVAAAAKTEAQQEDAMEVDT